MFDRLIESHPARRRPVGQTLASIALHAAIGVGAIRATRGAAEPAPAVDRQKDIVYLPVAPAPAPVSRASEAPGPIYRAPDAFQTPAPPVGIPSDWLPAVSTQTIEPGTSIPRAWPGASTPLVGTPVSEPGTFRLEEVDDPVSVVDQRRPSYPPVLQAAGIGGSVDVQFVVDTVGRGEASSWHVVGSTNRAFEAPARAAIMASRFTPARIKGRVVRQLVAQRITFTVAQ